METNFSYQIYLLEHIMHIIALRFFYDISYEWTRALEGLYADWWASEVPCSLLQNPFTFYVQVAFFTNFVVVVI